MIPSTTRSRSWPRSRTGTARSWSTEIDAGINGKAYDPGDPQYEIARAWEVAAGKDPELFRALLSTLTVMDVPEAVLAKPAMIDKIQELGAGWRDEPTLAPTREELLAVVAG